LLCECTAAKRLCKWVQAQPAAPRAVEKSVSASGERAQHT